MHYFNCFALGSRKYSKLSNLHDYLEEKTGVNPDQSGIYYFSHKGCQPNPGCKAENCHYVGKTKNVKDGISNHFKGNLEFDKCLKYEHPLNKADHWNLTIWPFPEDQLTHKLLKEKIKEMNSKSPNGHNKMLL